MLPRKDHEANPTELFQAVVQQNVRKWQALERRAEKYSPATIREAQIAVFEVLGQIRFNTAAFCSWYEARATGRHLQKRWKTHRDEESLKKVAIFQWSNKFYTVLKFFVSFPVECFSKYPQTRHDILNATTLRFEIRFFLQIT